MNATDRLALLAGTEGLIVVANTASDDSSTFSLSGRRALQYCQLEEGSRGETEWAYLGEGATLPVLL